VYVRSVPVALHDGRCINGVAALPRVEDRKLPVVLPCSQHLHTHARPLEKSDGKKARRFPEPEHSALRTANLA
jgi:hypothetical protein